MPRIASLLGIFLLLCFAEVDEAGASAIRAVFRTDVSVSGDVILLSHLLVKPVPDGLLDRASRIPLGKTPQFGTTRCLSRSSLQTMLADAGFEPDKFLIPESVTLRRAGRTISKGDILLAIQSFLANQNTFVGKSISSDSLTIADYPIVPDIDLKLYVKSSAFDAALRRRRVSIASRAFPQMNRIEVNLNDLPESLPTAKKNLTGQDDEKTVLVKAGLRAQVTLEAGNTRMVLTVVPLARGYRGEVIRVRLANSAKYLNARVVAQNSLEATY